jgi:capsular polysaccharide biosynthesis protein
MVQENTELIDYLGVIWKWKLPIILITVVCAITSGVVSFVLPKIYQSSAIIEVGRIPRYRGTDQQQIEPIEDIESVSEVLESDEMLSKIKEKFNLQTTLGGIRASLDVEPVLGKYIGSRLQARLIKTTFEEQDSQLTVDVLNTLSDLLMEQHLQEYQASIKSLDEEIANSQEKIRIISNEIAIINNEIRLQSEYQKVVHGQIKVAEKAIAETRKELSQLSLKNISPLEVLFLRSTLRDQEGRIAGFHRELKDVELSIEDNKKSIAERQRDVQDLRDKVVYLEHMRAVSENTKVRDKPIKPEIPVRPRKKLNAIIGGVIGFVAAIILAFFFEYLQTVRMRKREEAR